MNSFPCSVCSEAGHRASHCPCLTEPLRNGFYKPSGGRPISDGDDDEHCKFETTGIPIHIKPSLCLNLSSKSVTLLPTRPLIWNITLVATV